MQSFHLYSGECALIFTFDEFFFFFFFFFQRKGRSMAKLSSFILFEMEKLARSRKAVLCRRGCPTIIRQMFFVGNAMTQGSKAISSMCIHLSGDLDFFRRLGDLDLDFDLLRLRGDFDLERDLCRLADFTADLDLDLLLRRSFDRDRFLLGDLDFDLKKNFPF